MTLATPSAKSHERVTGRWQHNTEIRNSRDQLIYYFKQVVGTPIPALMLAYAVTLFVSHAAVEIVGWAIAILTTLYILADRYSATHEFKFFRIGSDFFLAGLLLAAAVSAIAASDLESAALVFFDLRWVLMIYALAYCWELFPGLNRIFYVTTASAVALAGYCIWQHFVGIDAITGAYLQVAPAHGNTFFLPTGLFTTPEVYATLFAVLLPLIATSLTLRERQESLISKVTLAVIVATLLVATLFAYRPGFILAAIVGIVVSLIVKPGRILLLALLVGGVLATAIVTFYHSPQALLERVQNDEEGRAVLRRAQINHQVEVWSAHPWVGDSAADLKQTDLAVGSGNVYFWLMARFGAIGAGFYLLFILNFLLMTYRIFNEIPVTHYWHRVLVAGGLGAQIAFHVCGLFWTTLLDPTIAAFFAFMLASLAYLIGHYERGIVSDDYSI